MTDDRGDQELNGFAESRDGDSLGAPKARLLLLLGEQLIGDAGIY
jgi:hypothetical protein